MDFETEFADETEAELPLPLPLSTDIFEYLPQRQVLKEFYNGKEKTGEIRLELGADGVWLQFDCECLDALPYCQAQCCALIGTTVEESELEQWQYPIDFDGQRFVMQRDADGYCTCLNKQSRTCDIYQNRPETCQQFHCTRGADVRGWKLANHVHRQAI